MSNIVFTDSEVKKLRKNKYVRNVSNKSITYTDEFKEKVVFETENYKNYDGQGFQTKTSKHYTATGTINGQSIGTITGSGKEVTAQLRAQGFSDKDIKAAMENGQVQIARQNPEAE